MHEIKHDRPRFLIVAVVVISFFFVIFPIYYLILTAFKPLDLMFNVPPKFYFKPSFSAFETVLGEGKAGLYLFNSFIVTTISTVCAVFLGGLAAFVLALVNIRGKKWLYFTILITRMYPPVTTLIPIYMIMQMLKLVDHYPALILPYVGTQMALATMIMLSYYKDLPVSIFESAMLDGCGSLGLFLRFGLPLSKSGLIASGVLIFVLNWNEFLFAMALTSTRIRTAPVALTAYLEQEGLVQWGSMAAMGSLMTVPIVIFALALRKYMISGLTAGASKE